MLPSLPKVLPRVLPNFQVHITAYYDPSPSRATNQIDINFEFTYNNREAVKLKFGTLTFSTKKNSDEKYKFDWNYGDCSCVYTECVDENKPEGLVIKFEKFFLYLKEMC